MIAPLKVDVVVIGAGPVGLFSVFTCGMMRLKVAVIDTFETIGGQCSALYPEKPIYDIPGFPEITAQQLIDQLEAQAKPFAPSFHMGQKVVGLEKDGDEWVLTTSDNQKFYAKAVIIAAGAGAFGPNRPPLEGLARFEGKSVFYHVPSKEALRGKRVVLAGGGDSAVDWAIVLHEIAAKVSLVHRRDHFRAAPESLHQLRLLADALKIELIIPYQLSRLEGTEEGALEAVWVSTMDGQEKRLEADVLLSFFGLSYDLGPLATWGLAFQEKHIVVDPLTCATSLPGIYSIGDIATYPHKRKLILTGFSEAAQAAQAIRAQLFPGQSFHFTYSTTSGIPRLTP